MLFRLVMRERMPRHVTPRKRERELVLREYRQEKEKKKIIQQELYTLSLFLSLPESSSA